ncbi:MAG TPA: prepilin-type N-terminal cleavage/methylation domain-containing protein [Humisphaera sp.]
MAVSAAGPTTRAARHARRRPRRALTLVELSMSLAVLGVILAATASVVVVAARALAAQSSNPGALAASARSATDQIVDDLAVATAITEQTATAVTMTVPDRNGDGAAETVRYAWSGVAGDPVTRSYNGGTAVAIATDVRAFNLSYLTKTAGPPAAVESSEMLLAAHYGGVGSNIKASSLTTTAWPAEYFKIGFPAGTTSWKVTRCRVLLQKNRSNSTGTVNVELRYADAAGKPTGAALGSIAVDIVPISTTSSGTWVDLTFPTAVSGLDPTKGAALVVTYAGGGSTTPGAVLYDNASTDIDIMWTTTANGGTSWTTPGTPNAMQFYVWGTYTAKSSTSTTSQPLPPSAP